MEQNFDRFSMRTNFIRGSVNKVDNANLCLIDVTLLQNFNEGNLTNILLTFCNEQNRTLKKVCVK